MGANKHGYDVRTVNLASLVDEPDLLIARCNRLQAEMLMWLGGRAASPPVFDGTFGALFECYLTDPESSYRKLKASSARPYDIYARKVKAHIGARRIDACDGRDVGKWFKVWAGDVVNVRAPGAKLPAARMALTVLKAAVSFGIVSRLPGCPEFMAILRELEFPSRKRRTFAPTAEQVTTARSAAHSTRRASRALAYAIQFKTTLRQWDVIGEWVPLSDPRPSAVLGYGMKWLGPTWAQIDHNLILRTTPSKTENTSEVTVEFDLRLCPMVMDEIADVAPDARKGPLIVDERTAVPYTYQVFKDGWRKDFKAAGIPHGMWNRDLRAGGITEGKKAGAALEDRSTSAGHSGTGITAKVYDRDTLESHRRVARVRTAYRPKNDVGT